MIYFVFGVTTLGLGQPEFEKFNIEVTQLSIKGKNNQNCTLQKL